MYCETCTNAAFDQLLTEIHAELLLLLLGAEKFLAQLPHEQKLQNM